MCITIVFRCVKRVRKQKQPQNEESVFFKIDMRCFWGKEGDMYSVQPIKKDAGRVYTCPAPSNRRHVITKSLFYF